MMDKNIHTERAEAAIKNMYQRFKINDYIFQIELHRNKEKFFSSIQKLVLILTLTSALTIVFISLSHFPIDEIGLPILTIIVSNLFALVFNISGRARMHAAYAAVYEHLLGQRVNDGILDNAKTIHPE